MTTAEQHTALSGRFNVLPIDAVIFGTDAIRSVGGECERLGIERLLLIVSPSLTRSFDVQEMLDEITGGRVVATYAGSRPHVPHETVLEAAALARETGVDGVISVGGGSPVDLAKAVRLCLAEDVRNLDGLARFRVRFEYPDGITIPPVTGTVMPQIAVSTTLSAGEFTDIVGITDSGRRVKDLYIDPALVPKVIVLDPALCLHTPRELWASTGLRAVDHAVEALCSTTAQPVTDALSSDALRRLTRYLPQSAADATDLLAAGECQIAAWQSIFGLANVNVGLSHGIGHMLGARCGVPHGITSCVMLPSVLSYNLDYTREPQAAIAAILAAAGVGSADEGASELLRRFIASLGLPTRLRDVGVPREEFRAIAEDALADAIVASNPRPIRGVDEVVAVLEIAY